MIETLWNNKRKIIMAFVLICIGLLVWIGYEARKEYETLSERCKRVGGVVEYDAERGRVYCKESRRPAPIRDDWWRWWWQ